VDERRGLQGVALSFIGKIVSREPAEFLVDNSNQFLARKLVALTPGTQIAETSLDTTSSALMAGKEYHKEPVQEALAVVMTPQRLLEIRSLFESAVGLPQEDRHSLLNIQRHADPALAEEVDRLLAAHALPAGFMEQPIAAFHPAGAAGEDLVASRIGAYEVIREIGRGGMGTVYEAARVDGAFRKRVAIKVIRATLLTEAMQERFRRERQILAGLDHPNIAHILDGGTTETGRPFFVMEHVSGVRIDVYCCDHRLGVDGRLDLFSRVCDAVQYAHDHLIVHCDLKPGNILITSEGGVKLLDFGIAKILSDPLNPEPAAKTVSALILTPEYASPEQVQGKPVTTAADVYLLGVLLYELLTRRHPMHDCGVLLHEVMRAVCEHDPLKPSAAVGNSTETRKLRRQLKGELDDVVLLALQKDPARRYASVSLAMTLRDTAEDFPSLPKPIGWATVRTSSCAGTWYRLQRLGSSSFRSLPASGSAPVKRIAPGTSSRLQSNSAISPRPRRRQLRKRVTRP